MGGTGAAYRECTGNFAAQPEQAEHSGQLKVLLLVASTPVHIRLVDF